MLELQNIYYTRDGKDILKNVSFTIHPHTFVAITGPNGSGKSTLAKMIMGILQPDSGKILFNGEDITHWDITKRAQAGIGFAFQQPVRFKGLTVQDLIEMAAGHPIPHHEACHYLSDVGLCAKEYIHRELNDRLSGGELKRIEIAMLAAKQSSITIFDEPEAGIDLWSFQNLMDVFSKMHEKTQGSIVIISHQEKILSIADEIIVLSNGEIQEIGKSDAFLEKLHCKPVCKKLQKEEV